MNTIAINGPTVGNFTQLNPVDQVSLAFLARHQAKPATFREYKRDLKIFLTWCADNEVDPLLAVSGQLEMYLFWLTQQGWAESTIARRVGVIKGWFHRAYRDRIIAWDPAEDLTIPTVDWKKQHRTFLNAVDLARWVEASEIDTREHAICTLLAHMGLRVGELTSLNIDSLRREAGWHLLSFVGKGSKAAVMRVQPPVAEVLLAYIDGRQMGPMFLNRAGGRMTRAQVAVVVTRVAARAGVSTEITPHSIRRSVATNLLDFGTPLSEVQSLLRHESPTTTTRYDQRHGTRGDVASSTMTTLLNRLTG